MTVVWKGKDQRTDVGLPTSVGFEERGQCDMHLGSGKLMVWEVQYDCLQPQELAEVYGHELQGDHQRGRAISSSFAAGCHAEWAEGRVALSTDPHWPGLQLPFF